MLRFLVYFIIILVHIGCIKKLERNPFHYLGFLFLNPNETPQSNPITYQNGSHFILNLGDPITIYPPNHKEGSFYTIIPPLPMNLVLDSYTGVISGIVVESIATTTFTITQILPNGTQFTYTFTITVNDSSGGGGNGGGSPSQVATPTFSPLPGIQTANGNITISTTTPGAIIYFTTDGSNPTTSSTLYTTPLENIWSLAGKTIKAFAVKNEMLDSAIFSGVYSIPPLKTGQTTSYTSGDDGNLQPGIPRNYTDNGDGTITDHATGLLWQKCSRGQNNDSTCSGTATSTNWSDAVNYCNGLTLAGKIWRLPTKQELETLPNYGFSSTPIIDTTMFPNTVMNIYWSSTTYEQSTTFAWYVNFLDGFIYYLIKTNNTYVRCVSGNWKGYSSNFSDNGDGTIIDHATGLVWQKCSRGQTNDSTCSGSSSNADWAMAVSYCNGLTLASRTWRLPTINEWNTIVDTTKSTSPSIDTLFFPSTVANNYWSSTTYAITTSNGWILSFDSGYANNNTKTNWNHVRCVSGP